MGRYLNRKNDMFQQALNSAIYVDKSEMLAFLNGCISTEQKYLCISRPRRFGKSMTANMLNAYYGIGNDSHNQFDKLIISKDPSYEKYLNHYNVIQINMLDFLSEGESVTEILSFLEEDLREDFDREFEMIRYSSRRTLSRDMDDVYRETGIPFVIIIDEWDCIFREYPRKFEEQKLYLDYLRNLMMDKPYIALAYMTGILPVKKYGAHSALNMFAEYSMTNQRELSPLTGFTEAEVKELCDRYQMSFDETKYWYDGYDLNGFSIYNPRSVVMSMTGHIYDNYWTRTETFEALRKYIVMDFEGLHDDVTMLLAGGEVIVNINSFANDMTTFEKKDDILTLLIHLGYLAYDFDRKTVRIPNKEIMEEFETSISVSGWQEVMNAIGRSEELLAATLSENEEVVADLIEEAHMENASIIRYNDENSLASVLSIAYYSARKDYVLIREMPSGKGYADIVFLPRKNSMNPALVIELKWDKSVKSAIDQIKERDYPAVLSEYKAPLLLVGISYDVKTKKHSCRIEKCNS